MAVTKRLASFWVVSLYFHVRVAKINFDYVTLFVLGVDGELFGSIWGSEGFVEFFRHIMSPETIITTS